MVDLPAGVVIRKVGNMVHLGGRFNVAEGADDWILLFTLPHEYRPKGMVPCGVNSETGALEIWIEPDGSVLADSPRPGWVDLEMIDYVAAA